MTTPSTTAAPSPAAVDQALAERCQTSGDYIAGLLTHGHLEAAGTVTKMPTALFPDWPADMVQAVWEAALPVGFHAGRVSVRPTWAPDALNQACEALDGAGYTAMGRLAARSAALHPPRHPADADQPYAHDDEDAVVLRDGGGW
ncbi:hypothetical protein DBP19_36160 [Streptomyces sp. CS090A]|uniref:hypothetical protein n=1 Tax=Streptomyces sp. CS090A TaxID=2162710 RepID=UPI000D51787B|nr:hypothetical protein [Streptomyces sp. CS090A]PVC80574.1 hypothetical protein DBP19_36160 [Streptomyces sp. CS090A]